MAQHDHLTGCGCGLYRDCQSENQRLRAALRIVALRPPVNLSHAEISDEIERIAAGKPPEWDVEHDWRTIPLNDVYWGREVRAANAVIHVYATLGDLADASERDILRFPNVGKRAPEIYTGIIRRAMAGEDVRGPQTKRHTLADMARGEKV